MDQKLCIKLLPLLSDPLKLYFETLYKNKNLDPFQGPTNSLTHSQCTHKQVKETV